MIRQLSLRLAVLVAAFVAASFIAWWAIPVTAGAFGAMTPQDRAGPLLAGLAAMLAWGALLVWNAIIGPAGTVAALVGGVLQVRPFAVYLLTLAFAGLLAVCSAIVARAVARSLARPSGADDGRAADVSAGG